MEEGLISESDSMFSSTIGRLIVTLLNTHPRKLRHAINLISFTPRAFSPGGESESLWFFHKYVRDAVEKEEPFDSILIPMVEHSLKCKESRHVNQPMILLMWLFEDELLFEAIVENLVNIIFKKDDRYMNLGWCFLVRRLLESDILIGIKDKYFTLLKMICPCMSQLLLIVRNGSILHDGYELPTRLSMAAADCFLAIFESLVKNQLPVHTSEVKSIKSCSANQQPGLLFADVDQKRGKSTMKTADVLHSVEMEFLLWDHLSELFVLLQKLIAWSWKSRFLHAKGLEQVVHWLREIQESHGCFRDEAGADDLKAGILLLSSCWKHYGMLLHLDDHRISQNYKELLDQYLSGIQFYTDNIEQCGETNSSGLQTMRFFLNCLSLLLGRLDSKQLELTVSEYGLQISQLLISQLWSSDEDVIDQVFCIYNAVIFKVDDSSFGIDAEQKTGVFPLLLSFLDDRDNIARAVVTLTAEYCSRSKNDYCIQEILKRLASVNLSQRRNAIDVISTCLLKSSHSENGSALFLRQDLVNHLLECLKDEEFEIRLQASELLPSFDLTLVLPALVQLVHSSNESEVSHATAALMAVLKHHDKNHEVIYMLLDCVSNFDQNSGFSETSGDKAVRRSKLDSDPVLKLIPEWSKSVTDWNFLIEPLIDKMFAEPSNPTVVRFLSYVSEYLADAADTLLNRVLLLTKELKKVDEAVFSQFDNKSLRSADSLKLQELLFNRLCPLLIVRLLPLRVFNDANSSTIYGKLSSEGTTCDHESFFTDTDCVAALLFSRAFSKFEFEDVRKLAAELCGRIHPQVLFPVISSHLDHATKCRDILKIKACLFTICTSLVIRGRDSILHHAVSKIMGSIESVLLWPLPDGDEVSKAQHGCIDCLALMICAELQCENVNRIRLSTYGQGAARYSVLTYVIHQLTSAKNEFISPSVAPATHCLPFRLCMANVLISACQKISDSCKNPLARETLPCLTQAIPAMAGSEVRAACIQVLFSCVCHLKSAVLPYAPDLLKISLKLLNKGSEKEKMASAKLLGSLMASEDAVVGSISGELLEARAALSSIALSDPSVTVRQLCHQLSSCLLLPS